MIHFLFSLSVELEHSSANPGKYACPGAPRIRTGSLAAPQLEDASHIQTAPDNTVQGSEQSCKGMLPFILPRNKTEQNICQQSRPYLPTHCILVVTHEVGELKRLPDFFEENFNGCLIEVINRTCRPNEVVSDEGHAFRLSVDFDDCLDQTQSFRISVTSALSGQSDDDILKNIELGCAVLSNNIILHIVLGAGDPENAALGKPSEMFEVDICLVKDDNFAFVDPSAKCRCFRRIVSSGCFYKNEIQQTGM